MTLSFLLEDVVKSGLAIDTQWYTSLLHITENGTIQSNHLNEIKQLSYQIASRIKKHPLSIQRSILQSLLESWETIADTSNMPVLSDIEKDIFTSLYSGVSNIIPDKYLTTNMLPVAIASIKENLLAKNNVESVSKKLETYMTNVGIPPSTIESILEHNPLQLFLEPTVSFHTGLHILNEHNQPLFLKIYSSNSTMCATQLAQLEAKANFYLSQIPTLKNRIAGTPTLQTQDIDDLSIGVQFDVLTKQPQDPGIYYWLDGYALLSTQVGPEIRTAAPSISTASYNYQKIKEIVRFVKNSDEIRSRYQEGITLLEGSHLILTDTKEDNRMNGREIDLERIRKGNLAIPLPLLFASYGIQLKDKDAIHHYVNHYTHRLRYYANNISATSSTHEPFHEEEMSSKKIETDLQLVSYPLVLKELSGIESRRSTPRTLRQKSYLCHFLGINQ